MAEAPSVENGAGVRGKVVAITGASGGIGEAAALTLTASGAARAILYAVEQPADVDVNEIVIRPTAQA